MVPGANGSADAFKAVAEPPAAPVPGWSPMTGAASRIASRTKSVFGPDTAHSGAQAAKPPLPSRQAK